MCSKCEICGGEHASDLACSIPVAEYLPDEEIGQEETDDATPEPAKAREKLKCGSAGRLDSRLAPTIFRKVWA